MLKKYTLLLFTVILSYSAFAQIDPAANTCPTMVKRSNGNGQASSAAGVFKPASTITLNNNSRTAINVVGSGYDTVRVDYTAKTGDIHFRWVGAAITNLPVITRVWLTASGSTTATLSNIQFGPPPAATVSGTYNDVTYAFYNNNMPAQGKVTLEFSNAATGEPAYRCTYDLGGNGSATPPTISCAPTFTTQPTALSLCGATTASFTVAAKGATSYQWQDSTAGGAWVNITATYPNALGHFTTYTTKTLNISSPNSYNGHYFRAVATGGSGCGSTASNAVRLVANPYPTAVFNAASYCGVTSQNLQVNLTGTAPWSITYNDGTTTTQKTGINASPYYINVSPGSQKTYTLTAVSDAYCSQTVSASTIVYPTPVISLTSSALSTCYNASANPVAVAYTVSTGTVSTYSIDVTGVANALTGYVPVTNVSAGGGISVLIPAGSLPGTYYFNLYVKNAAGCISAKSTFSVKINAAPVLTASSAASAICASATGSIQLSAQPTNLANYSWTSSGSPNYLYTSYTNAVTNTPYVDGTQNASYYNMLSKPLATRTYTVTGTNSLGCMGTASVTITVNAAPVITLTPSSSTICSGSYATITATSTSPQNLNFSWTSNIGGFTSTSNVVNVNPTATTIYSVTGTDRNGCTSAAANQTITVTAVPTIGYTGTVSTCYSNKDSITVKATGGTATNYTWTPLTGIKVYTGTDSVHIARTASTTYTVYGNTGGCSGSASVPVTISSSIVTSAPPRYVVYCGGDYSGAKALALTLTTSTNTNFTWQVSTDGVTWNSPSGQITASGTTTSSSTTLSMKTPGNNTSQYFRVSFTNGGCTEYYYTDIRNLATTATKKPLTSTAQTICTNTIPDALSFNGIASGSGTSGPAVTYTYQWEQSNNFTGTYATVIGGSGATTTTYTPPALTQTTYYRLKFTASGGACTSGYSDTATITVNNTTNTISVADACAPGLTISGNTPGGVYSWESSSDNINYGPVAGVTTATYQPPVPTAKIYYRRVSTAACTSSSLAIYPPITGATILNAQTVCQNAAISNITVTPSGGDVSGSFNYTFQSSPDELLTAFSTVQGPNTTSTYPLTSGTAGTTYYRVNLTRGACSVTTDTMRVIINASPTVSISPTSLALCQYKTTDLTASGALTYTWTAATSTLSASTGSAVTLTAGTTGTYSVQGTSANGCTSSIASYPITVTASPSDPGAQTPVTACTSYNFPTSGGTLEWFAAPDNSLGSITSASASGTYYVYSKNGGCYSQNSSSLALTIHDVSAPVLSSSSINICGGTTVDITSYEPRPLPTGVTYEWHTGITSGSPLVSTPTAANPTVNTPPYYAFAKSSSGCYGASYSQLTINVASIPAPGVLASPSAACAPTTFNLTNYISSPNYATYTYEWHTSATDSTNATLVADPTSVSASNSYYLFVKDAQGCMRGNTSSPVALVINTTPSIVASSPDVSCAGNAVDIAAVVTGGSSPTHAWQYSSNGTTWNTITNGSSTGFTGTYTNANTATLHISDNTGLDAYQYRDYVTNNTTCQDISNTAIMAVQPQAEISSNPVDTSIVVNGTGRFYVSISGSPTAVYQWQYNNGGGWTDLSDGTVVISGTSVTYAETSSSALVIYNAPLAMNGYQFRAKIVTCSDRFSNAATLIVGTCSAPSVGGTASNNGVAAVCSGKSATLSLSGNTGSVQKWQYSNDNFVSDIHDIPSSNTTPFTVTNVTTDRQYRAVVLSPGCSNANSDYAAVTVNPLPALTSGPASSQLIATGNAVTLSVTASNTSSFQWKEGDNDLNTGNSYSIPVLTQSNGGTFKVVMTSAQSCQDSVSYTVTPSVILYSKSTGNLNTASNWGVNADGTGSTPVDFTRSEHTFIVDNHSGGNIVTGGNLTIAGTLDVQKDITEITAGTTLTAARIIRSTGNGTLYGSTTSNLVITGLSGNPSELYFASGGKVLKNLTISNAVATLHTALAITGAPVSGTVTINSGGQLVSNGNLTLSSAAAGTARVAQGDAAGGYIVGDVTVERYIPANANRAWRFLSIPTSGSQTIHDAWQEGQEAGVDPGTGYGTIITHNSASTWASNGFDFRTPQISMMTYDSVLNDYVGISSTLDPIATTSGYLLYLRGDRSMTPSADISLVTPTILRTTGPLYLGDQSSQIVSPNTFLAIGNIYPSAIDFNATGFRTSVDDVFYIWDPKITGDYGVGGYQTFSLSNGWEPLLDEGTYADGAPNTTIEEGQAFFVYSTTGGSVSFKESAKTTGNKLAFSPSLIPQRLKIKLYSVTDKTVLADAAVAVFNDAYSNSIDASDAQKMWNRSENFGLIRNNVSLAIEARKPIAGKDTLYCEMYYLKQHAYRLSVIPDNMPAGITAYLQDTYLNTNTPIDLTAGSATYDFTITSNAASSAPERFRIVFDVNAPLPVSFTSIKAAKQNNAIAVNWTVSNESGIRHYEAEHSSDGVNFSKLATLSAKGNNNTQQTYDLLDSKPFNGNNYYRVKSVSIAGKIDYTPVVKVSMENMIASISVYPNPVSGSNMGLQFINQPAGIYSVKLFSNNGQLIYQGSANITGANTVEIFNVGNKPAAGTYNVEIRSENNVTTRKVIFN